MQEVRKEVQEALAVVEVAVMRKDSPLLAEVSRETVPGYTRGQENMFYVLKDSPALLVEAVEAGSAGLDELNAMVLLWAQDRNLLQGSTREKQMLKLTEEMGELAAGIAKGKELLVQDSIGDCLVVLSILAAQSGLTLQECLLRAWLEIRERKGKMLNGVFVKEEDLA